MRSANLLSLRFRSAYSYPNCCAMKASRVSPFIVVMVTMSSTGSPLSIFRSIFRTCLLPTSAPVPQQRPLIEQHRGDPGDRFTAPKLKPPAPSPLFKEWEVGLNPPSHPAS